MTIPIYLSGLGIVSENDLIYPVIQIQNKREWEIKLLQLVCTG